MYLRPLVAGEILLAVGEQLLDRQRRVLLHHEQLRHLARMLVRHADRRHFEHAGMAGDHVLELVRKDLEARDQDHVLLAVDDLDVAALVHEARCRRT